MGRKRKTRWRRLSIGEVSGNEEEEVHEMNGDGDSLNANQQRSASQLSLNNSSHGDTPTMSSKTSLAEVYPKEGVSKPPTQGEEKVSSDNSYQYHHYPHHQYNGHHHHSHYNHYNKDRGGERSGSEGAPQSNGGVGSSYHNGGGHHNHNTNSNGGGSYYQPNYYQRNSYNNYRNTNYDSRGGDGGGYQSSGSDYNYSQSSRYAGRFRKPRPYSSNYYYNNGTTAAQQVDNTNRPSYNQDEYTKITTPRQDVLFKKGYLSQRKPTTQSSVESTSSATTPSASTNSTPDTHSTNGVNSDYSEGYENGETDCGIPPYDDTVYYGPPAEAVFTDPNTGQVYYGQCSSNGEYFDAYPVSSVVVAGYQSAPVYYQLSYPPMDWNGVPNPYVPVVAAAAFPAIEDQLLSSELQGTESVSSWSAKIGDVDDGLSKKSGESARSSSPPSAGSPPRKRGGNDGALPGNVTTTATKGPAAMAGHIALGSSSCNSTASSSPSSLASTPMSPPSGAMSLHHSLPTSMSNLSLSNGSPPHLQPHPHVLPHFLANIPPPTHPQHQQHHHGPQPPLNPFLYPHPTASFVYGPPIYNGVVVPIAPTASSAAAPSSLEISSNSRKKRKKRRRKKDGQLTDESSEEDDDSASVISNNEEDASSKNTREVISNKTNIKTQDLPNQTSEREEKLEESESRAQKKDLISEEESSPEINEELPISKVNLLIDTSKINETDNEHVTSDKDETSENTTEIEASQNIDNPTEASSTETKNTEATSTEAEVVNPSVAGESSTSVIKSLSLKKPVDLTVLCPFNSLQGSGNDLQLLSLQRSPDGLEPSSPDSLNTNQSVAGSEIASVSESDLMNRTTSLDEVEEDLPIEGEEIETKMASSSSVQSNNSNAPTTFEDVNVGFSDQKELASPQHFSEVSPLTVTPSSSKGDNAWEISPNFTPSESIEPSPSPETIFEQRIEPPIQIEEIILETVEVPDEPILECQFHSLTDTSIEPILMNDNDESGPPTLESHSQLIQSIPEEEDLIEIVEPVQVADSIPLDMAQIPGVEIYNLEPDPPDIAELPPPPIIATPAREEAGAAFTFGNVDSATLTLERPTSITLVVSEWLKAQGEDALTPVALLQAQFEAECADEADGEGDDDDDDDESLKADEFANLEQNQKNVHGNPWVVPSNKPGAMDGICSRVACVSNASSLSISPLMKPEVDGDNVSKLEENLTDDDSGLEHSSPEASPTKMKVSPTRKYVLKEVISDKRKISPSVEELLNESNSSDAICDPHKFTKYYQFGVVFEKDQGIKLEESLSEDDNTIPPITCKNVMLTCDFDKGDEEVGTFVPIVSKSQGFPKSLRKTSTLVPPCISADTFVQKDKTVAAKAKAISHLYVNPFSLASEMGMDIPVDTPSYFVSEDFSWDDAMPLPPYESPSPSKYPTHPVFNQVTSNAKLIRSQDQFGSLIPIPRAICCVIQ